MKRYIKYIMICLLLVAWNQASMAQQTTRNKKGTIRRDTMSMKAADSAQIPIGYGQTRTFQSLTGAVSTIGAKAFDELGLVNPANALYGKLSGLIVLENAGTTPTSPTFYIRGQGTFTNSSPLVLVDGFERPMARLAPEAIRNISVLKDAAALAIYGQRGANGVILVTTKRGSNHPLQVHASFNQSITQPTGLPELVGAADYARALNEALVNDGSDPRYNEQEIMAFESGKYPYFYPNVDWMDKTLRNYGLRSVFNVTFDGGGDVARYFALLNYEHNSGIFGPVNHNKEYSTQQKQARVNFRSNIDINLTDNLLLSLNAAGILDDNNQPQDGGGVDAIMNALYSIPSAAFPVKTPDGNWGGTQIYGNNPVAILTSTGYGYPNNRSLLLDGHLRQKLDMITKGLSAEVAVSYTSFASYFQNKSKNFRYELFSPVWGNDNIVDTTIVKYGENSSLNYHESFGDQRRQTHFIAKLNYNRSFGDHELKAIVLFHQNERVRDGFNNIRHRRNFAANIHYGLDGKYYFDVAASYSGNNWTPPGHRYHFYPAVSAAWLLSKEDFLSTASAVDFLKLRASWGITGNDDLPNSGSGQGFPYRHHFNRGGGGYRFKNSNGSQPSFVEMYLPAVDFRGETSNKANIGIDARMFGGLILSTNLFYEHRTNILTGSGGLYSAVLGIAGPRTTNGVVDNKGLEASLEWQDKIGDLTWHIGGQFLWAHNEIVNMNETYRPYPYLKRTGREVGQLFGLEAIGFFKDQQDIANSPAQKFSAVKPGDIKYKDQNNDGTINQFDEVPVGYHTGYPNIYYSAFFGIHYKGFGLSALFQGTGQYTGYMNTESVYWPIRKNNTISKYYYNHRWTPETAATATLPRLTTTENSNNFRQNDIWLVDRSYLKLRSLRISYKLSALSVDKLGMDDIRFIAEGRDLFSIDNIPVGNPDKNFGAGYPILRSYSLGLEVAF